MALAHAHRGAEGLHLLGGHQAGMVILVAGKGQAHALNRIGDEAGGLVARIRGRAQRIEHRLDIVAAQIGHQPRQIVIVVCIDDGACRRIAPQIGEQRRAPCGAPLECQRGIQAVGTIIDPRTQRLAARPAKGRFLQAAVLDAHDVPAHVAEQALEPSEQPVLHHAVQALPVIVHNPPDIADIVLPALQQGFVDIAFVQLGIAGNGDVAAGLKIRRPVSSCSRT